VIIVPLARQSWLERKAQRKAGEAAGRGGNMGMVDAGSSRLDSFARYSSS